MKPDQERVKNLLTDTVTLLCKNSLTFSSELRVEGLLGITLDNNDIFLININQKFGGEEEEETKDLEECSESVTSSPGKGVAKNTDRYDQKNRTSDSPQNIRNKYCTTQSTSKQHSESKQKRAKQPEESRFIVKQEPDDLVIVDTNCKGEPNSEGYPDDQHYGNDDDDSSTTYGYDGMDTDDASRQQGFSTHDSNSGDAFITGVVQNVNHNPLESPTDWQSASISLSQEVAQQMAQAAIAQGDNSLSGLSSAVAGCSSWGPPLTAGQGSSSNMFAKHQMWQTSQGSGQYQKARKAEYSRMYRERRKSDPEYMAKIREQNRIRKQRQMARLRERALNFK